MELHGMAHDVGHFVVAPVVHPLHGMQDAALYGLESVTNVRDRSFQYHIRSIVQKPVLVHLVQMVCDTVGFVVVVSHVF